jgi:hypothetical protein
MQQVPQVEYLSGGLTAETEIDIGQQYTGSCR